MTPPADLGAVLDEAWHKAQGVPGFIGELEFRALGMIAACAPGTGATVEIGSFKGKSTIGLASVAAHYGFGPVVSIDPHSAPSVTDPDLEGQSSSLADFLAALQTTGLEQWVEVHRVPSRQLAIGWDRPIRILWIDGDHTYAGAKEDFDLFSPYLTDGAIIALHDTLHEFEGPIRVFVENILRSEEFGPSGFLHTIGWSQYRPHEGSRFHDERERLARSAEKLIPFVQHGREVRGLTKLLYKLRVARVPHAVVSATKWAERVR